MTLPDPATCERLSRDVAPVWVWFDGMLFSAPSLLLRARVEYIAGDEQAYYLALGGRFLDVPANARPSFADTLTATGALLVAREVWGDPALHLRPDSGEGIGWRVHGGPGAHVIARGRTELEATIAAILAAPEKS